MLDANQSVVKGLQPASLWSFFASLSNIPRPSKLEHRCMSASRDFVCSGIMYYNHAKPITELCMRACHRYLAALKGVNILISISDWPKVAGMSNEIRVLAC